MSVKENEAETKRMAVIDARMGDSVKTAASIIKEARKAGAAPEKIRSLIGPLVQDIGRIAQVGGLDPSRSINQLEALINTPVPQAEAVKEKPLSDIGKLVEDVQTGRIPAELGQRAIDKKLRDETPPNIVEAIRRKIAVGEQLTPGEERVYEDVKRQIDPIAALLADVMRNRTTTPAASGKSDPLKVR